MTRGEFYWQRQPEAERLCLQFIGECVRRHPQLARFEQRLIISTSGRLLDWVDHLIAAGSPNLRQRLAEAGFERDSEEEVAEVYRHPGAQLPRILLSGAGRGAELGLALRVESIADFLQANARRAAIAGSPFGPCRQARLGGPAEVEWLAVERRGPWSAGPVEVDDDYLRRYFTALETWQTRSRGFRDDEEGALAEADRLAAEMVTGFGAEVAAHLVYLGERRYWLSRNFAGRLQQGRQDNLGLGWGNQDHLTFRSSRRHFSRLVTLFRGLGFRFRERFYAGAEAGWGAQIMEQPRTGLTLFLDVDLAPEEVATDFAREELPPREEFGTVGLWCALHGDSFLRAGPHHLAGLFDFHRLIADLARYGVDYMPPFSNFAYLKQAFSVAERWPVEEQRVAQLAGAKAIDAEQGEKFLAEGAIGSHLENIQRGEGYKGFNRKNVSAILRETDPRR